MSQSRRYTLRTPVSRRKQLGQGVVGFIVASAFVLVPGILALNYLARVGDTNHKNLQAARYATWERTVWGNGEGGYKSKTDAAIRNEIEQRVFAAHERPLNSREDRESTDRTLDRFDPMVSKYERKAGSSDRELVMQAAQEGDTLVQLRTENQEMPGNLGGEILDVAGRLLGLNLNGFINSEVSVELTGTRSIARQLKESLGEENVLRARAHNAMLIGPWNAAGPRDVAETVSRTVPTELLDFGIMDAVLDAAGAIGFDEFDGLDFGYVDPERVPCHRLAGAGNGRSC